VKLIFLGTAGYHPNEQRHTSCLMLPEAGIVLDAGTGMFRLGQHIETTSLDIFLSHAHLDHIVGLTYLLDILNDSNVQRLAVHGAQEKITAIQACLLSEHIFPAELPCEFKTLADTIPLAGDGELSHFPLEHPGGSLGFRLDWPTRSLAYITDTTASPDAAYLESIRGVDLLVHECNFPNSENALAAQTGHSCTSAVAEVAKAANVGGLLLTHFSRLLGGADPVGIGDAQRIFSTTELACDSMAVEF